MFFDYSILCYRKTIYKLDNYKKYINLLRNKKNTHLYEYFKKINYYIKYIFYLSNVHIKYDYVKIFYASRYL